MEQNTGMDIPGIESFFKQCLDMAPDVQKKLTQAISGRERDFLELGEGLQSIAALACRLTQSASSLTELTSGESVSRFIHDLSGELSGLREVCDEQASVRNINELQNILATIESLISLISEFKRIVRTLQMLGMSTRIESARLGDDGRGFTTLADDVEGLAHNIEDNSAKILDKSRALEELASAAMNQSLQMRVNQNECSLSIFASIQDNLEALQTLNLHSHAVSNELAERTAGISNNIGEVVSSLQFHDIIRQQIEHVCEALTDMRNLLRESHGAALLDNEKGVDLTGFIADVCSVQCSQLANGRERFAQAMNAFKSGLRDVELGVQQTQASLAKLTGASNGQQAGHGSGTDENERVLTRIEESIRQVILTMHEFSDQGSKIGQAMSSVASTVKEIASFLNNIEEIGSEIELIAINASVKAAHTGDKGAALGVLASAIQHLSINARTLTDSVSEVLRKTSQAAEVLDIDALSHLDSSQIDALVERLQAMISSVKSIDAQTYALFSELNKGEADLGQAISAMTGATAFQDEVAAAFDDGRKRLSALEAQARKLAPPGLDKNRPERLKNLLARYTMEVERLIHESAMSAEQSRSPRAKSPSARASAAKQDDLGDNVELF
jgi:methyl-accepting chemotaxis protein